MSTKQYVIISADGAYFLRRGAEDAPHLCKYQSCAKRFASAEDARETLRSLRLMMPTHYRIVALRRKGATS
jgi:hypothetical protein